MFRRFRCARSLYLRFSCSCRAVFDVLKSSSGEYVIVFVLSFFSVASFFVYGFVGILWIFVNVVFRTFHAIFFFISFSLLSFSTAKTEIYTIVNLAFYIHFLCVLRVDFAGTRKLKCISCAVWTSPTIVHACDGVGSHRKYCSRFGRVTPKSKQQKPIYTRELSSTHLCVFHSSRQINANGNVSNLTAVNIPRFGIGRGTCRVYPLSARLLPCFHGSNDARQAYTTSHPVNTHELIYNCDTRRNTISKRTHSPHWKKKQENGNAPRYDESGIGFMRIKQLLFVHTYRH